MESIIIKTAITLSGFFTGLIWFVQIVHYPLFLEIKPEKFTDYEQKHTKRTGLLVAPTMVAELIFGIGFWYYAPSTIWNHLALVLLLLVWASTFLIQVPLHNQLAQKRNETLIKKLIQSNWVRTICWTLRLILMFVIIGVDV